MIPSCVLTQIGAVEPQAGRKVVGKEVKNEYCRVTRVTSRFFGDTFLADIFESWGLRGRIVGMTPRLDDPGDTRGTEIAAWIQQNCWSGPIVILDDDSDMGDLIGFLVQTSFEKGLTLADTERAIAILRSQEGVSR